MIIDTDVLIWYLRGHPHARDVIAQSRPFDLSVVTYIELVQGMRNKDEQRLLQRQLQNWSTRIIHIDQPISTRAMFYVEEYCLSHSMQMADALIAATAIEKSEPILTANDRHYRHIPRLQLTTFKP